MKTKAVADCFEVGGGEWCRWERFITCARPASLWTALLAVCKSGGHVVSGAYVGVTRSPVWRWSKCRRHDSMMGHTEHYDCMHVLAIDHAATILQPEVELIQLAFDNREALGCRLDNRIGGGTGTARYGALALYVVTRRF